MTKATVLAFTFCSALALLSVASPVTGQTTSEVGERGRTWALVIGVSRYPRLPGGQQLQFAERDATDFARAIAETGPNLGLVRILVGQQATSSNIKSSIGNWLARSASEADTVCIFFSGHAFVEPEFKDAYLLGFDSDPKDPYTTGVSLNEISYALSHRVRARRVLIIADAVRRDLFPPESDTAATNVFFDALGKLASSRPGLTAMMGSGPGEFSREGQRWGGRGVFTKHLLDGLSGLADVDKNGEVTASEAFEYVASRVSEDTSNKQRPWKTVTAIAQAVLAHPSRFAKSSPQEPPPTRASTIKPAQPALSGRVPPSRTIERKPSTSPPEIAERVSPQPSNPGKTGPAEPRKSRVEPPASREISADINKASTPSAATPLPSNAPTGPAPPPRRPAASPPEISPVVPHNPAASVSRPGANARISSATLPPPPRPSPVLPRMNTVAAAPARNTSEAVRSKVPDSQPGAPPSPLALQLEAAIESGSLIEPEGSSAWDIFQQLSRQPDSSSIVARVKPGLGSALLDSGRAIVRGDVRSDNISQMVDEFKRAGQLFSRARSLMPGNDEAMALEKLSAAAALIALQFFDEAEMSLSQIRGVKLAAVENALGIVFRGKLDDFRAERAFKRSIDLDPKWASPHYNLALLYKSAKRENVIEHLSRASELDPSNPWIQTALGDEHFERGQWQPAIDAYRKAISLKQGDDALHTKLGHALYSQGLRDEANSEYQKAADLRKRRP